MTGSRGTTRAFRNTLAGITIATTRASAGRKKTTASYPDLKYYRGGNNIYVCDCGIDEIV